MSPLFIKEHTAQLSKREGALYQEQFIKKEINDEWYHYLDKSKQNYFYFGWNSKEGARWWLDILTQNNMITVRRNNLVRKFQTAGLLDKMAEVGISWEEIDAAMSNEEF